MKVFKLYFKIVKKNIASIIAYVIAFVFIALLFGGSDAAPTMDFEGVIVPIAFINQDDDTILIENLKTYLQKYVSFEEVDMDHIPDALYFREIMMALIIPKDFSKNFLNGEEVKIDEQSVPAAAANFTVSQAVNKYLKRVKIYLNNTDESIENIIAYVNSDLSNEVEATRSIVYDQSLNVVKYYYNYMSYLLFGLIISVVCLIMMKMNRLEIKRRVLVSPYPQNKYSFQLYICHLCFSILVVILFCGLSFLLYQKRMMSINGLLYIINAFVFMFSVLGLAFLIGNLVRSLNVLSAIVNVISLGTAFLCGAFVPLFLLGKEVRTIAHIFPNYYYVMNNERIGVMTNFSWDNLSKLFVDMGIQLLFTIVYLILAIVVRNRKRQEENYAVDQTTQE